MKRHRHTPEQAVRKVREGRAVGERGQGPARGAAPSGGRRVDLEPGGRRAVRSGSRPFLDPSGQTPNVVHRGIPATARDPSTRYHRTRPRLCSDQRPDGNKEAANAEAQAAPE